MDSDNEIAMKIIHGMAGKAEYRVREGESMMNRLFLTVRKR